MQFRILGTILTSPAPGVAKVLKCTFASVQHQLSWTSVLGGHPRGAPDGKYSCHLGKLLGAGGGWGKGREGKIWVEEESQSSPGEGWWQRHITAFGTFPSFTSSKELRIPMKSKYHTWTEIILTSDFRLNGSKRLIFTVPTITFLFAFYLVCLWNIYNTLID